MRCLRVNHDIIYKTLEIHVIKSLSKPSISLSQQRKITMNIYKKCMLTSNNTVIVGTLINSLEIICKDSTFNVKLRFTIFMNS